jgi:hypothetical protein
MYFNDAIVPGNTQLAGKNKNRLVVEAQENLGALKADSMRLTLSARSLSFFVPPGGWSDFCDQQQA